jgi:hypothetical protein
MLNKIFLIGVVSIFCSSIFAYDYALGGRISNQFGITFKYNYKKNIWLEGIADIESNAMSFTGLFEEYYQTPFSKNFNWFVGGGAYAGHWSVDNESSTWLGVRGVLGLCYNFNDIPVDLSIDWMPAVQIVSDFHTDFNIFGLSVRYTF